MRSPLLLAGLFLLALHLPAGAHPIPDIPVQATFDEAGAGVVRIEVDLRFFDAEPATAPYFKNEFLPDKPPAWRAETIDKARAFVAANIEFFLEPGGRATPVWEWAYTGLKNAPLAQAEDPVVLTGTWRTAAGARGYRIRSAPENRWSVLFLNTLRGKEVERTQVLFPGETSFVLEVAGPVTPAAKSSAAPWWRRLLGGA
jgi:hypothetical protein